MERFLRSADFPGDHLPSARVRLSGLAKRILFLSDCGTAEKRTMLAMQIGSFSASSKRGRDQPVAPSGLTVTIRRADLDSLRTFSITRPSASSTATVSFGNTHSAVSGTAIPPARQV